MTKEQIREGACKVFNTKVMSIAVPVIMTLITCFAIWVSRGHEAVAEMVTKNNEILSMDNVVLSQKIDKTKDQYYELDKKLAITNETMKHILEEIKKINTNANLTRNKINAIGRNINQ